MIHCWLLVVGGVMVIALGNAVSIAQGLEPAKLPKVVLIGDSIRIGYAPDVQKALSGKAEVISNADNGEDSKNVLAHLTEWVLREQPDVVHFNCGLHDLKLERKNGEYEDSPELYEANLKQIVTRLKKETTAKLIFATTTPINDQKHVLRKMAYDRFEADVLRYNKVAERVMKTEGIEIDDLHAVVMDAGMAEAQLSDGTHYTAEGYKKLADAVAGKVLSALPAHGQSAQTK